MFRSRSALLVIAFVATQWMALSVVPPAAGAPVREPAVSGRGLWVWQPVAAKRLVDFAREAGVTRLWVATSSEIDDDEQRRLAATQRLARRHGLTLAALGGAPGWALRHHDALTWARASARVVGDLHVDVEPYALPAWNTDRRRVVREFLVLLERLRALPGRLEVDVPFWYGEIDAPGGTLADAVLDRVDSVTVMSYRDSARGANGILDVSRDWLRRSAAAGIPVTLGAETNPLPDCPHCTFAEEGTAALDREQAIMLGELRDHPTFAGVAVHDWAGWRALGRA